MKKKKKDGIHTDVMKQDVMVRHTFSDDEKLKLAHELARATQTVSEVEDEKKQMGSLLKSRLDAAQATANGIANKISCGYEMRTIEATVDFDPKKRVKHIRHPDTGKLIETQPMNDNDWQINLKLEEGETTTEESVTVAE